MTKLGFNLTGDGHPIIPVMIGEASLAKQMADMMLKQDVYVIAFSYPVVPKGLARIRTQMSALHSQEHLDKAINAFETTGKEIGII